MTYQSFILDPAKKIFYIAIIDRFKYAEHEINTRKVKVGFSKENCLKMHSKRSHNLL